MPDHPRTPLPPAEHDPDGRATHAPRATCCRMGRGKTMHLPDIVHPEPPDPAYDAYGTPVGLSRESDARLAAMGDPASYRPATPAPTVLPITLDPGAQMPTRANPDDVGLDLYPLDDTLPRLMPHETRVFDTGVHVAIPPGYYGQICGRSGLAGRSIQPGGGVIDQSYRGSIGVVLTNHGQAHWTAAPGKPIAQLVVIKCELLTPVVVGDLGETERGDRGFGSSDGRAGK